MGIVWGFVLRVNIIVLVVVFEFSIFEWLIFRLILF